MPKHRISGLVEFSYTDRCLLSHHDFPTLCPVPLASSSSARQRDAPHGGGGGNRSSVSSEGFCENETDADLVMGAVGRAMGRTARDSDSQVGHGGKSAPDVCLNCSNIALTCS